jgi:hypothetical protein
LRGSQRSVLSVREQRTNAKNAVMAGDCRFGLEQAEQLKIKSLTPFFRATSMVDGLAHLDQVNPL